MNAITYSCPNINQIMFRKRGPCSRQSTVLLKTDNIHGVNFFVIGGTLSLLAVPTNGTDGYHNGATMQRQQRRYHDNDDFRCGQWQQSWYHDDSSMRYMCNL